MALHPELAKILAPAYDPCPRRANVCAGMQWDPEFGFAPRGFVGAFGELGEVELVLVTAEPGDPWHNEQHTGLESAYKYTFDAFFRVGSLYHKNIRQILDKCWPDTPLEEQFRKVWITDAVLCSAAKEGGSVPKAVSRACGEDYLLSQLRLFPEALVVALGKKAEKRISALGLTDFLAVKSVAPPGCNYSGARESWNEIIIRLRERRKTLSTD